MSDSENLKQCLLDAIKKDEWKKNIDEQEYTNNKNVIEDLHKQHLEKILTKNERFKYGVTSTKPYSVSIRISARARIAYQKWKEQHPKETKCPEVAVQNLLLLIHFLNSESNKDEQKELQECLKRQKTEFETFWDSPSYILKVLRRCIVTRDWNNATYFSLILLNYSKKYLPSVKKMCQTMVMFNPLIKECDLEDQFEALLRSDAEKIIVV